MYYNPLRWSLGRLRKPVQRLRGDTMIDPFLFVNLVTAVVATAFGDVLYGLLFFLAGLISQIIDLGSPPFIVFT